MLASLHPSDRPGPGTARRAWRASPSPHAAKTRPGASSTPCTVGASRRPREPLAAPTPTRPVVVVRVRRLARAARRPRPRCGPSERRHGLSPSRRACRGRATGAAHDVNRKRYPVHEIGATSSPGAQPTCRSTKRRSMTMGRSPTGRKWQTGRRANPLVDYNPHLGPALRDELANAKRDGLWNE